MDKWFQNQNVMKVIALLLGLALWLVVNDEANLFQEREASNIVSNVPLKALYDEDQFQIRGLPETISLLAQGPIPSMKRVDSSRLEAFIDLDDKTAGTYSDVPIQVDKKGLPGVEVKPNPQTVDVVLEEKRSKTVSVEVEVIGKPADDFKTGKPVVDPAKVQVRGSKEDLDRVKEVKAFVNVEGKTETISQSVSLDVYGEEGRIQGLDVEPASVHVEVPLINNGKSVPLSLEEIELPADGYAVADLSIKPNRVTVFGPNSYLKGLKNYPGPRVDLSDLKKDRTWELPVSVSGEATEVDPKKVTVQAEIVKGTEKRVEDIPIDIRGQEEGYDVEIKGPDRLDATLFGAPARLDNTDEKDVNLSVEVADLSPGQHQLPVQVELPDYIRLADDPHPKVTVEISKQP